MKPSRREVVALSWQEPGSGERYARGRFGGRGRARRDPQRVERLLRPLAPQLSGRTALDVPCGAGRLRPSLEAFGLSWLGADVSASMLAACPPAPRVRADAFRLPFRERSFDLVLCCRLLHHHPGPDSEQLLRELLRVSRSWLVASFWDSDSWPAWREARRRRRAGRVELRSACSRARMRAALEGAGGRLRTFEGGLRFLGRQTFFLAQRGD